MPRRVEDNRTHLTFSGYDDCVHDLALAWMGSPLCPCLVAAYVGSKCQLKSCGDHWVLPPGDDNGCDGAHCICRLASPHADGGNGRIFVIVVQYPRILCILP